ncbi:AAA family ATPase [Streptomyces sp. NPDC001928]|uniref:AAA family ATPase n=1 Tax=Streptomyces sp. NPDC001928 TaxID=3154404 RepID=UPI0033289563
MTDYDKAAAAFDTPGPVPEWAQQPHEAARYRYQDEDEKHLFTVHRFADKSFKQQAADGTWSMTGVRLVLFNLPAVVKAAADGRTIHLAEGEKDVCALTFAGHVATTAPGGAKATWRPEYTESLKGAAEVFVWQDKDAPGREHAAKVAESLKAAGIPHRIVEARAGKDAWDHLAAGWRADQALPVGVAQRLKVTRASEITPRVTHWLMDGKLAVGSLALLAGREGMGKSTVALTLAAQVTTGTMPGAFFGTPKSVVVVATEDAWEYTIKPRLMAAGADCDRVLRVEAFTPDGLDDMISLPADIPGLEKICRAEDVALIILDPLMSAVSGKIDTHKDHELRRALEPLTRLAVAARVTVLGLIHFNKTATTDPLTAIMGSRAFAAVVRAVLAVIVDPEDEERFLLGNPKNNLGRRNLPSLVYKITGAHVADTDEGAVWASKIEWLGEDDQSVSDVMEAAADKGKATTRTDEAAAWLREFLLARTEADPPCSASKAEVSEAGDAAGFPARLLRKAVPKAGVKIENLPTMPRTSRWSVDPFDPHPAVGLTGPTGRTGTHKPD